MNGHEKGKSNQGDIVDEWNDSRFQHASFVHGRRDFWLCGWKLNYLIKEEQVKIWYSKIVEQINQPPDLCNNLVIDLYSSSADLREIEAWFFDFNEIGEEPRDM